MSARQRSYAPVLSPAALALAATLVGLSGLAYAQPPVAYGGPVAFPVLDRDGDGRVSTDEFAQHRAQRMAARAAQGRPMRNAAYAPTFASWDLDGDGYLVPAELAQGQQARLAARGPGPGRGYGAGMNGQPCWRNR